MLIDFHFLFRSGFDANQRQQQKQTHTPEQARPEGNSISTICYFYYPEEHIIGHILGGYHGGLSEQLRKFESLVVSRFWRFRLSCSVRGNRLLSWTGRCSLAEVSSLRITIE